MFCIKGYSTALCLQALLLTFSYSASCNGNKNGVVRTKATAQTQNQNVSKEVTNQMKGVWGGQGIAMDVDDNGATLDLDCAHGKISEKMVADNNGKFRVKGLFARERPGPVRQGDDQNGQPAIYSGTLTGDSLTMEIVLEGSKEMVGTFTLAKGKTGRIRKCG